MNKYISNPEFSDFIVLSKYSKWLNDKKRRETWPETVRRYIDYFKARKQIDDDTAEMLYEAILKKEVMPSMRALMTAGEALDRSNIAGYNCTVVAFDYKDVFKEMMFLLTNGCFHPDTMIKTPGGNVKIGDVVEGDMVMAKNIETGALYPRPVLNTERTIPPLIKVKLVFSDGSVVLCTANHEIHTLNRGWVEAQHLSELDDIDEDTTLVQTHT